MLSCKLRDIFVFILLFQIVIYLQSCKLIFIPNLLINMAEGSSPKQSLISCDVTDASQKEMRNHRAKVRELMSAGESFITTLNESTGHENVALVNEKYHALDAEILARQGQTPGTGKSKSQGICNHLEALRLNIKDAYQKWHANVQNNSGLTPLDVETHSQQNQILTYSKNGQVNQQASWHLLVD